MSTQHSRKAWQDIDLSSTAEPYTVALSKSATDALDRIAAENAAPLVYSLEAFWDAVTVLSCIFGALFIAGVVLGYLRFS